MVLTELRTVGLGLVTWSADRIERLRFWLHSRAFFGCGLLPGRYKKRLRAAISALKRDKLPLYCVRRRTPFNWYSLRNWCVESNRAAIPTLNSNGSPLFICCLWHI